MKSQGTTLYNATERIVEGCDDLISEIVRINYPEIGIWPHTRVRSAIRDAIRDASNLSQLASDTATN
jgi:hypothetical protein